MKKTNFFVSIIPIYIYEFFYLNSSVISIIIDSLSDCHLLKFISHSKLCITFIFFFFRKLLFL